METAILLSESEVRPEYALWAAAGFLVMASGCASAQCQGWDLLPALGIAGPTPQPCVGGHPTVTREVLDKIKAEYLPPKEQG